MVSTGQIKRCHELEKLRRHVAALRKPTVMFFSRFILRPLVLIRNEI